MSHVKNAAICLLDDKITFNDIGPESGLVDAYFYDLDRPFLDNHIFLMYDPESKGKYVSSAIYRMKQLDSFYNSRTITVHGKPYYVYCYTTNPVINKLKKGAVICNNAQKLRLVNFWKGKDPWIVNNVFGGTKIIPKDDSALPLDDGDFDIADELELAAQKKGSTQ